MKLKVYIKYTKDTIYMFEYSKVGMLSIHDSNKLHNRLVSFSK